MIIKDARFISSNSRFDRLPKDNLPEYAFIGRSNVGKSSLINALVQRKGLAKTSATPGKTIAINHFVVNGNWYLVDLPGYGYAKRSKKSREEWQVMLANYISRRRNLLYTFVLVDSRIEPQNSDIGFMEWLGENKVPFCIVFTKADKLGKVELETNVENYKKRLLEDWEELPPVFVTSSETKMGREEILDFIEQQNKDLENYLKTNGL
ncbi:MAG: YihA family ribosome biogenesis GTP-binding protein [Bacteroidales bacterium]|nr:YihA family ribosome biogenesis GTP-binding protein [Bacteroidales bacterium]